MNQIYFGDNLPILRSLSSESIDLIYIDPPFNTGKKQQRTQIKTVRSENGDRVGFSGQRSDIGVVNIAKKEKAILDILYFRSSAYYSSLVWEKLRGHKDDFDFGLMKEYVKKFGIGLIRQIGFFLDRLAIDTEDLHKLVKGKSSYNRMSRDSNKFNSRWRLYFDDILVD